MLLVLVICLYFLTPICSGRKIDFTLAIIVFLLPILSSCAQPRKVQELPPETLARCEYKKYKGNAKITSVLPKKDSKGSKKEYEIKFLFIPEEEIEEPPIKNWVECREFLLGTDANPSERKLIEKYEHIMRVGDIFPCILYIAMRGFCTPRIFEFPSE